MNGNFRNIYRAVESRNWYIIDKYVAHGCDINASLVSTGPEAGYTALHIAIKRWDFDDVKRLILDYGANVNSRDRDGAQPIHLACFRGLLFVENLLEYGANVDAEMTNEIYRKYNHGDYSKYYNNNFDSKMTLLTFALVCNDLELAEVLLDNDANIGIKNKNHKTLLMYAIENNDLEGVKLLLKYMQDKPDLIDARDDGGLHAVHYLLPEKLFGPFRYNYYACMEKRKDNIVDQLINFKADINAMINDNPDTLLVNMAAYRCCEFFTMLHFDIPYSTKAKPLHYFMLPADPNKYVWAPYSRAHIENSRDGYLQLILQNYVLRRQFGCFVPEEEIRLMDHLVTKDPKVKKIVSNFQMDYVDNFLKKQEIRYGEHSMKVFDIVVKYFAKKLKLLVKDKEFFEAYSTFFYKNGKNDRFMLFWKIYLEIEKAHKRRNVMEQVEKISLLRKFIDLPYEIILIIMEYLDNNNVRNFVKAFYQDSLTDNKIEA